MSQMIGMDPGAVEALAGQLSSQADALSGTVTSVDRVANLLGGQWHGQDATAFLESWQRMHRPALVAVQGAIAGLAESARHNVRQQVETSSMISRGPAGSSRGGSVLARDLHQAQRLSGRYGWVAAPVVGLVPGVSTVLTADSQARLGQDVAEHRYMAAFQTGSSQVSSDLLTMAAKTKNPELALGALDVTLWSDVAVTASHDHLSTFTTWSGVLTAIHSGGLQTVDQILAGTAATVGHQLGGMASSFGKEAWGAVDGLF